MTYPSLPPQPTARWWWQTWNELANYDLYRVGGYGSNCHVNPNMPNALRVRRLGADPTLVLLHDGNELGPGGGVGLWSWRFAHADETGPEGNNRATVDGAVAWNDRDQDFAWRWNNGSWQVWW